MDINQLNNLLSRSGYAVPQQAEILSIPVALENTFGVITISPEGRVFLQEHMNIAGSGQGTASELSDADISKVLLSDRILRPNEKREFLQRRFDAVERGRFTDRGFSTEGDLLNFDKEQFSMNEILSGFDQGEVAVLAQQRRQEAGAPQRELQQLQSLYENVEPAASVRDTFPSALNQLSGIDLPTSADPLPADLQADALPGLTEGQSQIIQSGLDIEATNVEDQAFRRRLAEQQAEQQKLQAERLEEAERERNAFLKSITPKSDDDAISRMMTQLPAARTAGYEGTFPQDLDSMAAPAPAPVPAPIPPSGDPMQQLPTAGPGYQGGFQEVVRQGEYIYSYEDGQPASIKNAEGQLLVSQANLTPKMKENMMTAKQAPAASAAPAPAPAPPSGDPMQQLPTAGPGYQGDLTPSVPVQTISSDPIVPEKTEEPAPDQKGLTTQQQNQLIFAGMGVLDVGLEAAKALGPARDEARTREKELEARREAGTLGVDTAADEETLRQMTRPMRAIAEQQEKERQAVMAGMGQTRSAADIARLREERDQVISQGLAQAGAQVSNQRMARAQQELNELLSLKEYRQKNIEAFTDRAARTGAQIAQGIAQTRQAQADLESMNFDDFVAEAMKNFQRVGMSEEEARTEAIRRFYDIQQNKQKALSEAQAPSFFTGMGS